MGHPDYIIRNYRPGDLDKLIQLGAEVERLRQLFSRASLRDLIEGIGSPNHLPEDDLFVAEIAGNIMGYVDVMPELSIRRVVLNYLVHPGHRRKGLAKRLVECAIHRARELRAKIAHVNIPQDNAPVKRLFSKMGFRRIRRFLELRLDLSETHLLKANQTVSLFRHMRHGEEDTLLQIQNRSFADTWGFSPNTIEEIIYRTSLPNCSPEDVILAYDADKPIGYCWTKIDPGENKSVSGSKGRIYMLGVNQDHRGKGVGSQVLLAGLSYLKGKGIGVVELTVDSENKPACALYRSVGFDVWTTSLWYEKVLD